jgi:hypothetical protein
MRYKGADAPKLFRDKVTQSVSFSTKLPSWSHNRQVAGKYFLIMTMNLQNTPSANYCY